MRLNRSGYSNFADYLLQTGRGLLSSDDEFATIPEYVTMTRNLEELFQFVYGKDLNDLSAAQLSDCAILAPLNASVRDLNSMAIERLRGQSRLYLSTDEELDAEGNIIEDLPVEVLNNMYRPGLPVHNLKLKVKALVMCMRNMSRDVCNGTKLQVQNLYPNLIDCLILTGPARGNTISLPRIMLTDNRSPDTVILRRRQFPITLAYAMTIDKSQGQSLQRVGVALESPCFAHGQLYTALSRCRDPSSLALYVPQGDISGRKVKNVVWTEVYPHSF
jgi:ATP-dependent DNA helicase PIF1